MTPLLDQIDFEALQHQTLHIGYKEYNSVGPQLVFMLEQDDEKNTLDPYVIYMVKYTPRLAQANDRDSFIISFCKTIVKLQKDLAIHLARSRPLDRHRHVTSEEEAAALEDEAYNKLKALGGDLGPENIVRMIMEEDK